MPFVWTQECSDSFQRLKNALCSDPILAFSALNAPYILIMDSSGYAISGILSRVQFGEEQVLAYLNSALSAEEHQ